MFKLETNRPRTGLNLVCPTGCGSTFYRFVARADGAPQSRSCLRCGSLVTLVVPPIPDTGDTRADVTYTPARHSIGDGAQPAHTEPAAAPESPAPTPDTGTDRDGIIRADGWIVVRYKGTAFRVRAKDRHPCYADSLSKLLATGRLFVTSPPGSGKSTISRQIARDFGFAFSFTSYQEGLSESKIIGAPRLDGGFNAAPFVSNYEGSGIFAGTPGGVHLHDEIDGADANTSLCLNSALANGQISLPSRVDAPVAHMRVGFFQIGAANTDGTGATADMTGRNALDAALRDRFVMLFVHFDYDEKLEIRFLESACAGSEDEALSVVPVEPLNAADVKIPGFDFGKLNAKTVAKVFHRIRKNVSEHNVGRTISTRVFEHAAALIRFEPTRWANIPALLECLFFAWTPEEKEKALHGIDVDREAQRFGGAEPTAPTAPKDAPEDTNTPDAEDADEGTGSHAPADVRCPKCSAPMVRRTARRGRRAGQSFYGCSRWRKDRNGCDGTRPIDA